MEIPNQAPAPQAAGQLPEQPAPSAPASSASQPEFVTRAEAERLIKTAADEAFRRAQSLNEKSVGKVRQQLSELEKSFALQAQLGAPVDAALQDRARAQVLAQAYTEQQPEQTPAPTQPPAQAEPQSAPDPITAAAVEMMQKAGVMIEDNDPEVEMIKQDSPYAFLQSIDAAIQAKRARIQTGTNRTQTGVAIPGLGASSGQAPNPWQGRKGADLIREHFANK